MPISIRIRKTDPDLESARVFLEKNLTFNSPEKR